LIFHLYPLKKARMREIALHLLDIAENSVAAQAGTIKISVCEDLAGDRLFAMVQDDGKGMDPETVRLVTDPFVTSRTTRKVGLGIPLFKAAAEACNGYLTIDSQVGKGTCLKVEFQHSHIDRMPLGDLCGTWLTLVVAYPTIRWIFDYQVYLPGNNSRENSYTQGTQEFHFDSQPIKETLGEIPFSEPEVLAYLRSYLEDGIASVRNGLPETV
jgi:hypothetical protein